MSKVALRWIEMLDVMPAGAGKVSTSQVADRLKRAGYEVDRRTVERDLAKLQSLGVLIADASRPIGWSRPSDYAHSHVARMSDAEALSFHLVERFSQGLLPESVRADLLPYFKAAERKLSTSVEQAPVRRWTKKIRAIVPAQPLLTPTIPRDVRQAVTEAIMDERKLEISYRHDETSRRQMISPLGLIQHGNVFYMPARFDGYDDVRTLALHRIRSATVCREAARIQDFNLNDWIDSGVMGFGETGKLIAISLRFFDHAGDHLLESRLSMDQIAVEEDDSLLIHSTVQDTRRLRWWLLAFGSAVEIVKPRSLRNQIRSELNNAARRYRA
jgi:predicted DNA-binding transcriptional regulator YafY